MARIDRAKNTLSSARRLQNLSATPLAVTDTVGQTDPTDLYRVQLTNRSTLQLNLAGNRRTLLQLLSLKGPASRALKAIGRIPFEDLSRQQLKRNVNVLARRSGNNQTATQLLEAGTYYVRVAQNRGNSRYQLRLAVEPVSLTPPVTPSNPGPTNPVPTNPVPTNPVPTNPLTPTGSLSQTWMRQFGTGNNDYSFGTGVDSTGDLYVAGVSTPSNAFSGTGFVAKYRKDGTQEWQRSLSLTGSSAPADVAVDAAGNYYVVGAQVNGLNSDAFIIKYNSAGTQQWVRTLATTFLGFDAIDAASGVVIDGNELFVAGVQRGVPAPLSQGRAFVAKYTLDGDLVNSFGNNGIAEFGNLRSTAASGLAVANGNIYVTGITNAALETSGSNQVTLSGGDAFVASFNRTSGSLRWEQTLSSGSATDYGRGIAVQGAEIYIAGQTAGTLPSGSLSGNSFAGGDADAFLSRLTDTGSSGLVQWTRQFGGTGLDSAQAIAISATGNIYLTGETSTSLFGNALGGSDAWVAQAESNGNWVNTAQVGTAQNDEAYGAAIDSAGILYIAGQTQGTFATAGNLNQGNYDVWLARYF